MATLKDIAIRARVSTATVSHVINKERYVSPNLRERVTRAIRDLNYSPNFLARSLRTKQSKTVGMVIPDISNPFFPDVVRGAEDVLLQGGYTLLVGNSDGDLKKEETYYRTFLSKRVDGLLLIISPARQVPKYLSAHNHDVIPVVYLDRYHKALGGDVVLADNLGGSRAAVEYLVAAEHRKIGIITGPLDLINAKMRLDGYKSSLASHRICLRKEFIREGNFDAKTGYEQTRLLMSLPDRPTAIFCSSGPITIGCLRFLEEVRLRCPEDVSVISFDNLEWFDIFRPRITAVAQPTYELGCTGADILLKRLTGRLTGQSRRMILKTTLTVRESTAPLST